VRLEATSLDDALRGIKITDEQGNNN